MTAAFIGQSLYLSGMREALVVSLVRKGKCLHAGEWRNARGMWRLGGTLPHMGRWNSMATLGGVSMQTQTPPSANKPMTIRGEDGKPHLASDMKPQKRPVKLPRVRPIVPSIFKAPD